MRLLIIFIGCSLVIGCSIIYTDAHGTMVLPRNWFDHKQWILTGKGLVYDYAGMKPGLQCYPGCKLDGNDLCPGNEYGCRFPTPGCSCMWYKNWTHISQPTIFKKKYLTYYYVKKRSVLKHNPWRAPGFAHIDSPCGVAGGNKYGCVNGKCNASQGGYGNGVDAVSYKFQHEFYVTKWKRGDVVEAAWGIQANHGGGYSYRLCKIPKEGVSGLTEEICQKIPLKFFGNVQWAQYGEDVTTRVSFPAVRISKGTFPPGSQWTKNPIPPCKGFFGGALNPTKECTQGYQFPPPKPGLSGFGGNIARTYHFQFSIIDKLKIPKDIEPGMYVLSFRWDCEQTPQVWNTCSSILIE